MYPVKTSVEEKDVNLAGVSNTFSIFYSAQHLTHLARTECSCVSRLHIVISRAPSTFEVGSGVLGYDRVGPLSGPADCLWTKRVAFQLCLLEKDTNGDERGTESNTRRLFVMRWLDWFEHVCVHFPAYNINLSLFLSWVRVYTAHTLYSRVAYDFARVSWVSERARKQGERKRSEKSERKYVCVCMCVIVWMRVRM